MSDNRPGGGRTRRVFVAMIREEWRLHDRLFGGGTFGLFPVLVGLLVAGTSWLLAATGTDPGTVFAGLHLLVFVFGLHTGSIGLVGRDALRNLVGDLTLVVFSARTLPLSQDRLLAVFVVKDVLYYDLLFVLPIALGSIPTILESGARGVVAVAGTVIVLWTGLTLTFVLGLGVTIAALGLLQRGIPGFGLLAAIAGAVGVALASGVDAVAYTPYGVFLDPTLPRVGASVALLLAVFGLGALTFETTARRSARTVGPSFRRWRRRLGDPLATKSLLDLHRSTGGLWTVLFSAAILFGVTAGLLDLATRITGVSSSFGVCFGALLGLSGFTTYNWLTQSDAIDAYLAQPLSVRAVLEAKFRAFLLVGPIAGLACYAVALAWRGGPLAEALVGSVVLVGVACYLFGVTVFLTGLSPNEFLFDATRFGLFGVSIVVPLVPILVVGLALAPLSVALLVGVGCGGVALGLVGVVLYRRSVPRWSRRYRRG